MLLQKMFEDSSCICLNQTLAPSPLWREGQQALDDRSAVKVKQKPRPKKTVELDLANKWKEGAHNSEKTFSRGAPRILDFRMKGAQTISITIYNCVEAI